VVDRAEALLGDEDGGGALLLDEVRNLRVQAERARAAAEARVVELEAERARLTIAEAELAARGTMLAAEAQRGIEERIARARAVVERARTFLPQLAPVPRAELERWLAELEESLAERRSPIGARASWPALKKGELVWLPQFQEALSGHAHLQGEARARREARRARAARLLRRRDLLREPLSAPRRYPAPR
jgi:hypothetical protein